MVYSVECLAEIDKNRCSGITQIMGFIYIYDTNWKVASRVECPFRKPF